MNKLVSVIIPTYNREHTILRAVNSVISQDYKHFEIIIVDDGSTDNTKKLFENRSDVIYKYQENKGVSVARNFGISHAKGDYIAFLDSDDEWLSHKLSMQVKYFEDYPNIMWVHGNEQWIRNNIKVNQMNKHKKGGGEQFCPSLSLCLVSPSCVVLKKQLLFDNGMFREDFPACEDYDLWLKILANNEIGFIEDVLINKYGGHDDQLSHKYVAMDYWRIKSIDWVIRNRELKEEYLINAKKILLKKCKILLKGYVKHNNLNNYSEIESIQNSYK